MFDQITIVGNVGSVKPLKTTATGRKVLSFNIASNRSFTKSSGEKVQSTTWYTVSVWGQYAEALAPFIVVRKLLAVTGRLNSDPETGGPKIWTRSDGTPGASFEVTAEHISLGPLPAGAKAAASPDEGDPTAGDGDIPF